ncbi:TRAP transporter large permease [Vineibacter terrae]|uniref:TRAP transporter large permease protein n=1 Tax=Vineibacter terrae TaxID=2586908 RepID=A0A5C8PD07_9HYPH|nr:TRAP transporter large permease [Vineibacter terrae]TXL71620.1 TRAP transporter large permease [Vineibacter terrae]
MNLELLTLILIASLAVMLTAGQWTAFALGICGVLVLYLSKGLLGLTALSSVVWNNANSYILIAVPMFLLMGEVILRSGVSGYFYRGVVVLLGSLPGGLLHANITSCAVFSAVSGSSVATAATVGTVAIPEMLKRGYEPRTVFGSLAAGGTLGILIPPSIIMVLYGALVEESIARLFMAGVLPGLLMAAVFMTFIALLLLYKPHYAPPRGAKGARPPAGDVVHVFPVLGLLVVVLGSIYSGIATPTEASALGAFGAILLAVGYRAFSRRVFAEALMSTVKTTCMVTLIIIGAQILSTALTYSGVSRTVSEWIMGLGLGKWEFFVALVMLYIVLGCFVDGISMIYMTLPVLLPVVKAFGFDLVWFGVVLTVLIELGQITPPVGLNLFTIHAISGGHKFAEVAIGSTPYVALMLLVIAMLAFWPEIALWLPNTMRG